jgi:hypothetical protein
VNVRKEYSQREWIDPRIEIRVPAIAGRGMFARARIAKGEVVVVWGGTVFSGAEVQAGKASKGSTVPIGEGVHLGSSAGTYDRERDDVGDFVNHSCDPNTWMEDEVTLVARRDVKAGEELTADYAMWKDEENSIVSWDCNCGSSLCRGRITGRDWRLAELQERYKGHFSPFIRQRIRKLKG